MKTKFKFICSVLAVAMLIVPFSASGVDVESHIRDPIAAGDESIVFDAVGLSSFVPEAESPVIGTTALDLVNRHHGDCCSSDDHVRDPIAAGDVFGNDETPLRSSCPRCGGVVRSVCSGQRHWNGTEKYWTVACFVAGHPTVPKKCETVQSRFYTDQACVNYSNCGYRLSGSTSHIESYFHSETVCYDNHYCSLPKV